MYQAMNGLAIFSSNLPQSLSP